MDRKHGFSLPETIIVFLVISILVVLAIPQVNTTLELNRINTSASMVASHLSEAKMMSIKRNARVSFVLDESTAKIWLESNSVIIGTVKQLPQGMKIRITPDTSAVQEKITFNSTGSLVTQPATISAYNNQKRMEKKISVTLTGRISVADMNKY